ncbi:hypothetical protein K502DRAFT_175481 [Neoconidiobolus thromboides FSU 785]|nr:hypothetical protein K502DRAFT_175481 [Neoconidiobolus thromboides FSU 785]
MDNTLLIPKISIGLDFSVAGLSTIINSIILISLFKLSPLKNIEILITFLSLSFDLSYSALSIIQKVFIFAFESKYFHDNSLLCLINSISNESIASNNVCFVMLLAILRYFYIVKNNKINYWVIVGAILFFMIVNFSLIIVDVIISNPKVMPVGHYCRPRKVTNSVFAENFILAYNLILIIRWCLFIITIYYCYTLVLYHHYKVNFKQLIRKSMSPIKNNNLIHQFNTSVKSRYFNLIIKAVLMLICYTLTVSMDLYTLIPYMLYKQKIPPLIDLISVFLRSLLPLFNGIFILLLHDEIYYSFINLIKKMFFIK